MENGRIDYKVVLDTSTMQQEAQQVSQSFANMASSAEAEGAKIDNAFSQVAGNIGKAFAALTAAATFQQLSQKIMQVRGEFQQLEVAFETMLGSAQQADTLMSQLVSTAATTPFGLQEVASGAKQLLAYGTAAEDVNKTLVRLGDIAAGLSIPLNDLVYLYGTTMTQGRLYTQDLRQFMGRGIPLVEELAKQFGVTKDEVGELVTAGKVGFPEVQKAIESMTDEGSKFGGLMEKQSHTISGQISNIEDALDMMFNDLGKSSEGVINTMLSSASYVIEHYEQFGKVLLGLIAIYGEYKVSLMLVSAYQSMMAGQEAAISTQREAALTQLIASINAEEAAMTGDTAAIVGNTAAKEGNVSAIDQQIAATLRSLQSKQFEAQVNAQNAALEVKNAQTRAANSAKMLTLRQQEYNAAVRSGNMSQIVAARTALEAAGKEKLAATTALSIAQENAAVASKQQLAAQTQLSTFQTQVDTINKEANTAATGLWTAATNMATNAWKAFSTAMSNNPIGMVMMGITAAITFLSMFTSSTEEATNAVDKFRAATTEDLSKLETYNNILKKLPPTTQAHKEALKGAKEIGEKYNRVLTETNGQIKDQEKAFKSLTAEIKRQSAEKVVAESAENANTKALEAEKEAMSDLMDQAENASRIISTHVDAYGNVTSATEDLVDIQKITAAQWSLITQEVMSNAQAIGEAFLEGEEKGTEAVNNQVAKIEDMLRALQISDESIADFHNNLVSYVTKSAEGFEMAYGEFQRDEAAIAGLAGQTVNLTNETDALAAKYGHLGAVAGDSLATLIDKQYTIEQEIANINASTLAPAVKTEHVEYLRGLLIDINNMIGDAKKGSLADLRKQQKALKETMEGLSPDDPKIGAYKKQYGAIGKAIETLNSNLFGEGKKGSGTKSGGSSHSGGTTHKGGTGHKKETSSTPKRSSGSHKTGGKTNKKRGRTTTTTKKKDDPNQIKYEIEEMEQSILDAAKKLRKELYYEVGEATTDAMKEGTEKVLTQIEEDTDAELRALDERIKALMEKDRGEQKRIWLKQDSNRKEWQYVEPPKESIDEYLTKYYELGRLYYRRRAQIQKEGEEAAKKVREQAAKEQTAALDDYLEQYGNYTEKRKAIIAKYEREISEASTLGEKMALARQMQDAVRSVDFEALKDDINWEAIFEDLDRVSTITLQKLKVQLETLLKSPSREFNADDYISIMQKIGEIDEQLINRQNTWKETFGLVIPELEEQRKLIQEAAAAQDVLNAAQEKQKQNTAAVTKSQKAIADFIKSQGKDYTGDITTANSSSIMAMFSDNDEASKQLAGLFNNLSQAEGNLATSTKVLNTAQGNATAATEAADASMNDFATTLAVTDKIIHGVNDNIQSAKELVDQLGFSESKFGKGFSAFAESSQYATDAWESLKSGNVMGVANGVIGSLRTLGEALGEWGIGIFGSSDKTLLRDIEKLTFSNQALEGAVSRLTKTMEQQAGSELTKTYEQAVSDLKEATANTQELLARSGAAYNKGFFGIGGKGSSNKQINKLLNANDWQRISDIVGRTVTDVAQLWDLSSEEMGKLAEKAPDVWAKIRQGAGKGYQDITEYLDAYVEYYDKLIELQQQYNESLTQISFDEVKSGLAELINSTETNAYDVIGNVTDMMQKAILNIVMTKTMKPKLDKWYEDFAKSMADDTLSAMEHAALEQGYADIYKQAKDEVDRAYKLAGIDPNNDKDVDASTGAWSALGEETGRSIDGRLTAIQIQTTKIGELMTLNQDVMNRMDLRSMQDSSMFLEMQNLIFISTGYLERVARNSDALPQINTKLEQIRQNTDRL